jgi:UDP-N-acetylmuramate dehydrogenase
MAIQQHVNLKPYNSFGVSATAAWFASVHNPIELSEALLFAGEQGLPLLILGGGSNTLFVHDFPGLVLHMQVSGVQWLGQGQVRAGAGENWHNFVIQCMRQNLHGLENLALIPGTVGAAPFQNIGAYGV